MDIDCFSVVIPFIGIDVVAGAKAVVVKKTTNFLSYRVAIYRLSGYFSSFFFLFFCLGSVALYHCNHQNVPSRRSACIK